MNDYIAAQIQNMTTMARTFEQSCKMAALKNDGVVDKAEEKLLKQIGSITQRFIKDLERLK